MNAPWKPETYGPQFGDDRARAASVVARHWKDALNSNAISKATEIPEPIVVRLIREDIAARRQVAYS